MVFTLFKCLQQVTGTEKSESNYEEEKKRVEYRQAEHIMKIIIGGERLQLADQDGWVGDSEKIIISG